MTEPPSSFSAPLVTAPAGTISAVALLSPDAVVALCRSDKRTVLIGTLNGAPLRRAVRPLWDGRLELAVGQTFLRDIDATLGSLVEVEHDYDADADAVRRPEALAAALDAAGAREAFGTRPVSEQRRACMDVERGRNAATRTRRALAVAERLAGTG